MAAGSETIKKASLGAIKSEQGPRGSILSLRPSILGCSTALPKHYYDQESLLDALERLWGQRHYNVQRLRQFHQNLNIRGRHLALPKEEYFRDSTFGERNLAFQQVGLELAQTCVSAVL